MKARADSEVFSLSLRRQLVNDQLEATRRAQAQGQRIVARMLWERRVREADKYGAKDGVLSSSDLALPMVVQIAEVVAEAITHRGMSPAATVLTCSRPSPAIKHKPSIGQGPRK
jgi:hypothetical protein